MTAISTDPKALLVFLDDTLSASLQQVESFSEDELNTIPFEGSWTAAQVADHLTKSNNGMADLLTSAGKPAARAPDQRVPELKMIFLDFTRKLQSPEFILPSQQLYQKEALVANLQASVSGIKNVMHDIDRSAMLTSDVLGEITKLELLHFILYHTQRHIHQLKNIYAAINPAQESLQSV